MRHLKILFCLTTLLIGLSSLSGLAATFNVDNTNDAFFGSLRQAIQDANASPGRDTIQFNISGAGPHIIQPLSAFDGITDDVFIDGTTQNTFEARALNERLIIIQGFNISTANGFVFEPGSDGSEIKHIIINSYIGGAAIVNNGVNNLSITGCYLGTDEFAMSPGFGNATGIAFLGTSTGCQIGDSTTEGGNIISDNFAMGIDITAGNDNLTIVNNKIGVSADGMNFLGNGLAGIIVNGANNLTIGGNDPTKRNVIGTNGFSSGSDPGIYLQGCNGVGIYNNFIGVGIDGAVDLGNEGSGIRIENSDGVIIGDPGMGNVISGNQDFGIEATNNITNMSIQSNLIGTDSTGSVAIANEHTGIYFNGAMLSEIGGVNYHEMNVISGNGPGFGAGGIGVDNSNDIMIWSNIIGLGLDGTTPLGNTGDGISLDSCNNCTIGAPGFNLGNIISSNGNNGIEINGFGQVRITENIIGLDSTGATSSANGTGIYIFQTDQAIIDQNVISGNTNAAIELHSGADSISIQGNYIGTDTSGTNPIGNVYGILIDGCVGTEIGNTVGNIIGGNQDGIYTLNDTRGTIIQNNYIGTNPTHSTLLGQSAYGINMENSYTNTIGGPGMGNFIGNNTIAGIFVTGTFTGSYDNHFYGNYIGLAQDSSTSIANGGAGIIFDNETDLNIIGGYADSMNVIANNSAEPILMGPPSTGTPEFNIFNVNSIYNNSSPIFVDALSNNSVEPPVIDSLYTDSTLYGSAAPNAIVYIYADQGHENAYFIDTAHAGATGSWTKRINLNDLAALSMDSITAIQDSVGNSSMLANHIYRVPVDPCAGETVNAGSNQILCENNANVSLNGSATTGGQWITGTGSYSPNNQTLNATYTPSASEITSGVSQLVLQSTLGGCSSVRDTMVVTYTPAPTPDAGTDYSTSSVVETLNGTAGGASTTNWSTLGTGTFDDPSLLNAQYTMSAADTTTGFIDLVLTANSPGCNPVTDTITITYVAGLICDTLLVTSTLDDGSCGTLRAALQYADTNPGNDTITFAISNDTIFTTSTLTLTTDPGTYIDASGSGIWIQPDFTISPGIDVMQIQAIETTIDGLSINAEQRNNPGNRADNGIFLTQGGPTVVKSVLKGVEITGAGQYGAYISFSDSSVIDNCTFYGNTSGGMSIRSDYVTVRNSRFGTDSSGTIGMGGQEVGLIVGGFYSEIGGDITSEGNVFSGNDSSGIVITSSAVNYFKGNFIGTDITGTVAIPNNYGVVSTFTINQAFGDGTLNSRNIISGNLTDGAFMENAFGNKFDFNYFGTDITGMNSIPNGEHAIHMITDPTSDTIQNSIIANSGSAGIYLEPGAQNRFYNNTYINNGGDPIDILGDSQGGIFAPAIAGINADSTIYGVNEFGAIVEIYADAGHGGAVKLGEVVPSGFSFTYQLTAADLLLINMQGLDSLTAVQTVGSTSTEFSLPVRACIPIDLIIHPTDTVNMSATLIIDTLETILASAANNPTVSILDGTKGGSLTLTGLGTFEYVSDSGYFNKADSLSYIISNDCGWSDTNYIHLFVRNSPPFVSLAFWDRIAPGEIINMNVQHFVDDVNKNLKVDSLILADTLTPSGAEIRIDVPGFVTVDYSVIPSADDLLESVFFTVCDSLDECLDFEMIIQITSNPPDPIVHNALSLGDDNLNDHLVIDFLDEPEYDGNEIWIYNKWGFEVYHAVDYDEQEPWDGTYNGEFLPTGTYSYFLKRGYEKETSDGFIEIVNTTGQ